MALVKTLVITGYGTNCENECAYAAKKAGADEVSIAHFSELITGKFKLEDFNFLVFPGGFLDGDDLGSALAAAQRWRHARLDNGASLLDELNKFVSKGGIALGICNGFQLLTKLGLLPALPENDKKTPSYFTPQFSLGHNNSGRYEDRWCYLKVNAKSPCVFTKNLDFLYLPIRHGEGKLVADTPELFNALKENNQVVLQYANPENKMPTEEYPLNPNGSPEGIAGICDPTGRIFGLMPHPEAFNDKTNHPAWTRGESSELGTALFVGGVNYLKSI
ncbi:phosphoribosylformylglycinamidine synthase subunit PurQ [Desulfovibrio litoralis]|uniref:Phosphoribosylformylglycinamidine synthase subunit I n=1 Tax=Desulfovibrio litoralis DSM 11393 TaxID=1121455 RepID=A0A1M7RTU9_9BACT|nr:phosphoribosylformylglycinamidine synthase subunit PurQ [Desulfovibrio litoralis]SHN49518.1 phosphoribosylformylglycinamidine synthase subunit I [Desulfovibrio litoralis DSM 11393]